MLGYISNELVLFQKKKEGKKKSLPSFQIFVLDLRDGAVAFISVSASS